jgi:hypothetical protein
MTDEISGDVPLMQRLYDKIWLLAVLAFLFWLVTYILWGDLDVFSIPGVVIG